MIELLHEVKHGINLTCGRSGKLLRVPGMQESFSILQPLL